MKWQDAERELREWETRGCNTWMACCPITHDPHQSYYQDGNRIRLGKLMCPGLTKAAHNLMFARMYERDARNMRREMAGIA